MVYSGRLDLVLDGSFQRFESERASQLSGRFLLAVAEKLVHPDRSLDRKVVALDGKKIKGITSELPDGFFNTHFPERFHFDMIIDTIGGRVSYHDSFPDLQVAGRRALDLLEGNGYIVRRYHNVRSIPSTISRTLLAV